MVTTYAQTAVPMDTSKFAPQVAAQDPLQTQAATLAQAGIGSFQTIFTSSTTRCYRDFSTGIASAQALTGTGAGQERDLFKILCLHFNNKLLMQH